MVGGDGFVSVAFWEVIDGGGVVIWVVLVIGGGTGGGIVDDEVAVKSQSYSKPDSFPSWG